MDSMHFKMLLVLFSTCLVVLLGNSGIEACQCGPFLHTQQEYCESEFVLVIENTGNAEDDAEGVRDGYKSNNVKVIEILKATDGDVTLGMNKILTPTDDGLCMTELLQGSQIVVMGYKNNGRLYTTACDYQKRWDDLTDKEKIGFREEYKKGCECQPYCGHKTYCLVRHATCLPQDDGVCEWDKSSEYAACESQNE